MSWGTFTHNIALVGSAGYLCSAIEDAYGTAWEPFITTTETPTFPNPESFSLIPSAITGDVWEYNTLPTGNSPAIDVCSPDTERRFFVEKNGSGTTYPYIVRKDGRCGDDTFRVIVGPAGQVLSPASSPDARLTTTNRFRYHFENAGGAWSTINFNVSFYLKDSDSSGEWDVFEVLISINGSCSYITLSIDDEGPENSITKEAYAAIWPTLPFSGPQPVEQYTTPIWVQSWPVDEIFPDTDDLWAPLSLEVNGGSGIQSVPLSGNPSYTDRGSWWCHLDGVLHVGDKTFEIDMPGDLLISLGGSGFNTTTWPTTSATADDRSANTYFWAQNMVNNRIALGGIGDESISWEDFKTAYQRNKL